MQVTMMDNAPAIQFANKPDRRWSSPRASTFDGFGDAAADAASADLATFGVTAADPTSTATDPMIAAEAATMNQQADDTAVADSEASAAAEGTSFSDVMAAIGHGTLDVLQAALKYGPGVITAAQRAGIIGGSQAQSAHQAAAAAGAKAPVRASGFNVSPTMLLAGGAVVLGVLFLAMKR